MLQDLIGPREHTKIKFATQQRQQNNRSFKLFCCQTKEKKKKTNLRRQQARVHFKTTARRLSTTRHFPQTIFANLFKKKHLTLSFCWFVCLFVSRNLPIPPCHVMKGFVARVVGSNNVRHNERLICETTD
jgi:hypothetical protein